MFASLILITSTYRQFDQIWVLTGGGPARTTENLSIFVYNQGIAAKDIGQSNAIAFFMFFTIAIISILFIKFFNIGQKEEVK